MSEPGDQEHPTTAQPAPGQLARWAFGGPISPQDYAAVGSAWAERGLLVHDSDVESNWNELTALAAQDRDLMVASRRWRPGAPDPEVFCAGDVVALRALAAHGALREAEVVLDPTLAALPGPGAKRSRTALRGHLS